MVIHPTSKQGIKALGGIGVPCLLRWKFSSANLQRSTMASCETGKLAE